MWQGLEEVNLEREEEEGEEEGEERGSGEEEEAGLGGGGESEEAALLKRELASAQRRCVQLEKELNHFKTEEADREKLRETVGVLRVELEALREANAEKERSNASHRRAVEEELEQEREEGRRVREECLSLRTEAEREREERRNHERRIGDLERQLEASREEGEEEEEKKVWELQQQLREVISSKEGQWRLPHDALSLSMAGG